MALDLSQDYLVIDDPITVTYRPQTAEGAWSAGAAVTYAQRSAVTKEDVAADPALQRDAAAFDVWTARLGGVTPKIGDKVVADSVTWLVKVVTECDRDGTGVQRYHLACKRSTA